MGAVAYLSQSTYGINDKIWLNPANDYTTGCAGASATSSSTIGCLYDYSTEQGMKASTSGNIYGIYDMVGGSFEYVMGNFNNKTRYGGFGDVEAIDNKYINRYNDYNSNFIGDAMYETSLSSTGNNSWYGGFSKKPTDSSPWLIRGASYKNNLEASVFGYQGYTGGGAPSYYGFRPVLVIKSN